MKLKIHQWIILGMGIVGTVLGLYGKNVGWEHGTYFSIFYTGISLLWVPFIRSKRTGCNKKRQTVS